MTNYRNKTVWAAVGKGGKILALCQSNHIYGAWELFKTAHQCHEREYQIRALKSLSKFLRKRNMSISEVQNDTSLMVTYGN